MKQYQENGKTEIQLKPISNNVTHFLALLYLVQIKK